MLLTNKHFAICSVILQLLFYISSISLSSSLPFTIASPIQRTEDGRVQKKATFEQLSPLFRPRSPFWGDRMQQQPGAHACLLEPSRATLQLSRAPRRQDPACQTSRRAMCLWTLPMAKHDQLLLLPFLLSQQQQQGADTLRHPGAPPAPPRKSCLSSGRMSNHCASVFSCVGPKHLKPSCPALLLQPCSRRSEQWARYDTPACN